jgi:hypothetical protein
MATDDHAKPGDPVWFDDGKIGGVITVRVLADILKRMQAHQEKKRSMLRQLRLAASFSSAD